MRISVFTLFNLLCHPIMQRPYGSSYGYFSQKYSVPKRFHIANWVVYAYGLCLTTALVVVGLGELTARPTSNTGTQLIHANR